MLQFATCESSRFSIPEQVDIAIEAGCKWIRLTGVQSAETVERIIPKCQEAEVILVIDNDIDLVDRFRVHGLHLTDWTRGEVIAAREKLGPHAIMGVSCQSVEQLAELSGLDIDYIVVQAPAEKEKVGFYSEFVSVLKSTKTDIHPVAAGYFPLAVIPSILSTGIEGFELSQEVFDAPDDPASFLKQAVLSWE